MDAAVSGEAWSEGNACLRATSSRIARTPAPQARAWNRERALVLSGRRTGLDPEDRFFLVTFLTEGNPVGLWVSKENVTRPALDGRKFLLLPLPLPLPTPSHPSRALLQRKHLLLALRATG